MQVLRTISVLYSSKPYDMRTCNRMSAFAH